MTPRLSRLIRWQMLAVLAALWPLAGFAADEKPGWSVRVWRSTDGLPDDRTNGLAQTPDGFLWVVASGVLARFDGVSFQVIAPEDLGLERGQMVQTVICRRDGRLCLGLDRGMVATLFEGKLQVLAKDLSPTMAETMMEDPTGGVWIAYRDGAVFRVTENSVTKIPTRQRSLNDTRPAFATDGQGQVWLWKEGELGIFRDGEFKPRAKMANNVARMVGALTGGVWVCAGPRVYRFTDAEGLKEVGALPVQNPRTEPQAMLEDRHGAVWIGTAANGLWRYHSGELESVPTSHREVMNLVEDREGNLWVNTLGGGLDQVQPQAIAMEGTEISLPSQTVLSVAEGPDGTIWAVTQDGALARRVDGTWRHVLENGHGLNAEATCLTVDRSGAVWVGTKFYSLYRWGDGQLTSWDRPEGIISHTLRTMLISRKGDLWIGGEGPGSLQRVRDGKLENIELPGEGLRRLNYIRAMAEDANGDIWAGGLHGGLVRVRGDQVIDETDRTGPVDAQIRSMCFTDDGSLWIAYLRGGLGRLKDGKFVRITAEQGLYDNNLAVVMTDGRGWLWFGGSDSIFKVREQELLAVAEGRAKQVQSVQFTGEQSLRHTRPILADIPPGVLRSRDGRLWIPTNTALIVASPQVQHPDAGPAPVLITKLAVDGKAVAAYGGVAPVAPAAVLPSKIASRVEPEHRQVEIDFTALSFGAPENVRFRYRLENFEDRWIEAGTKRSASYSRLGAGSYRFHVTATNSDGVWNEQGALLAFIVEPFFWQAWWFQVAILVGFTSAVFAVTRYVSFRRLRSQVRTLEEQSALDRERARIARDIHDDLGGRLTKIVLLSGLVTRDRAAPEQAEQRVREISETARQLIKSLDETVWTVNPRNDTLAHLIDYVGQFAVSFLRTAEVMCHVDLPSNPPARPVSSDVRHQLLLAVKEAMNNIVRHAHASEVWLRVAVSEEMLLIEIKDNGQGFAAAQLPDDPNADGLRNMRQRMQQVGGEFAIESQPGAGTKITFTLPWAKRA